MKKPEEIRRPPFPPREIKRPAPHPGEDDHRAADDPPPLPVSPPPMPWPRVLPSL